MNDETAPQADEDKWLEKHPEHLRPIAKRYGKELYEFSLHVGTASELLNMISKHFDPRASFGRQGLKKVERLGAILNQLAINALTKQGWTLEQLHECQKDITTTVALANAPSKIVLTH